MRQALWLMPLLFVGCSCQRTPAAEDAGTAQASPAAAVAAHEDLAAATPLASVQADMLGAASADAPSPNDVLQRYAFAVLNRDQPAMDAAWSIASGDARHADDAPLRVLADIRTLRLQTQPPQPIGDARPPRMLEVPVSVRAVTASGTFRYTGWYRLQPNAEGTAWVIQSAKLQPTLD
ncbi:hypothetical protein [Stenotrophomonas sp. 24(2023)]|uniref:hypothetical protein n=1 Tax=Stenotrophomonas sp. 24(2023) TaxID=3068324 RepID=UPI0027E1210C|nr:hypothetical protein [Stenotrophomonas sp. 24(2023)]WMJ68173.1 hypothetical protein Q9R17_13305 [Stenotrophomonas sp. 24(2023)]